MPNFGEIVQKYFQIFFVCSLKLEEECVCVYVWVAYDFVNVLSMLKMVNLVDVCT